MAARSAYFRISLTLITALLVCIIAMLAGTSLWLLRSMHKQLAHVTATKAVLDQGKLITTRLADQPIVKSSSADDPGWRQFSRMVNALHTMENGLQYVSVTKSGVTVFHEQMTSLDTSEAPDSSSNFPTNLTGQINLSRKILKVGKETVPVVVFNVGFKRDDGSSGTIEVALRKDAVGREEETATTAITSMFKVSLITTVISFGICAVLVVWIMQREMRREKQRREQEHLVFAGVLANGIAHDFRNPMSSLRLDVQMIEKEVSSPNNRNPEKLSKLTQRVVNTMNRMDKVFQEFLYLSKPVPKALDRIQLSGCIKDCVEMLAAGYEQAGVRIEQHISDYNIEIMADQTSLRRAIINVLTNALQFSKKGDTVSLRLTSQENNALLEIIDQGPGIPISERKKIFDMFVSSRPSGTGLGLFLARTAVERAGGNIKVIDIPAGGSCFRITLPLTSENKGDNAG
ncbi:MAG: HAMP domain-containing sensor histidine kinase [Kiritimatiellae bacterium]|nr:HAMP domain-containing sensor histidine kinase [Kiritimatiellia bacterium]